MICSRCVRQGLSGGLEWDLQIGRYVHVAGGGAIWQECKEWGCGWTGSKTPPYSTCPKCGVVGSLKDGHYATARREY